MSYLAFHVVFILPPLLLLLPAVRRASRVLGPRALWTPPAVALIALIYTTPWDNYLVWRGVWWYGPDRVLGTIGYVPVEEYLFFILQPLLTGAFLYLVLLRDLDREKTGVPRLAVMRPRSASPAAPGTSHGPRGGPPGSPPREAPAARDEGGEALRGTARGVGVVFYLLVTAAGLLALTFESGLYLGLILAWVGPVLAAQWFFMAQTAARRAGTFALAVMVPTLYLWVADRVAIGLGIWSISPEYTTGLHLFGLPLEEAVFFLATNVLVVQGALLFLQPALERATSSPHAADGTVAGAGQARGGSIRAEQLRRAGGTGDTRFPAV